MIDILLLAGVALCVLSVLMAVVSVARTRAPRGAAIALVLGLVLAFAGAWLDPRPFGVETLRESWQRLVDGQISLSPDPVTAPVPETVPETAPEITPAVGIPAPAGEVPGEVAGGAPTQAPVQTPAAETPSTTQPSQ